MIGDAIHWLVSSVVAIFAVVSDLPATHDACENDHWTGIYDDRFRSAWLTFVPLEYARFHCWGKAQAIAESRLDAAATSLAGAEGIAQFMPGTWSEVLQRQGWQGSPYDEDLAIKAQAVYMSRMIHVWASPRPESERLLLATASYNQGPGNTVKAQKICAGARTWREIAPCVPEATPSHPDETVQYVRRIHATYADLAGEPFPAETY